MFFISLITLITLMFTGCSQEAPAITPDAIVADHSVMESVYTDNASVILQSNESIKTITISFAGDCTLGTDDHFPYVNSFPYRLEKQNNDYSYFFNGVRSIFQQDDITLVNLENTFTNAKDRAMKKFCFKSDPSYANILKEGNIEVVNIANNHIYDYKQKGVEDTVNTLKKTEIQYCGEGHIAYCDVKDIKIAFIGYRGYDLSIKPQLNKEIKLAKKNADIVVVSFHWGNEYTFYPNQIQLDLGRFAVDEGADIVVGHHPHVIQGIDYYKNKYIVYSLGNFCFGGNHNPRDKDTFIFQCHFIVKDGKLIQNLGSIIPCRISSVSHINDYQPTILGGEEKERVMNRIYTYSSKLKYGIKRKK